MTFDWDGNRRHRAGISPPSMSATRGTRPLPLDPLPSSPFQSIVARSSRRSLTQNRLDKFHLIL